MSTTNFYFTSTEITNLLSQIISEDFYLVPDLKYDKKVYHEIKSIHDLEQYLNRSILFFILHKSYQMTSLEMAFLEKSNKYIIMQRRGGPSIDFFSPGPIIKENFEYCGSCFIDYYPTFYIGDNYRVIKQSDNLKDMYNKIRKMIVKNSAKINLNKKNILIGFQTMELLKQKRIKIVGKTDADIERIINHPR